MKTILLFIFLFWTTIVVGQTDVKYLIENAGSSGPNELIFITQENYYPIAQRFVRGKTSGNSEGMTIGNENYWKTTISFLKERYFTKEQLALFKEKKYSLMAYMHIDNVGNIKTLRLLVSRGIINHISKKALDDLYQALWKLKIPMSRKWDDRFYWVGSIQLLSSFERKE